MQWLIVVAALIGAMLNARGKWQGFVFWLVSGVCWTVHNIGIDEHGQALQYAVFSVISLHGLIHWRKRASKYSEQYSPPLCGKCGRPKRYGGPQWLDHAVCKKQ